MPVVLVEHDVAAAQRRFPEVVDQFLLPRGEPVEPGDLVAHDLQVGELVDLPLELLPGGGLDLLFPATDVGQQQAQAGHRGHHQ